MIKYVYMYTIDIIKLIRHNIIYNISYNIIYHIVYRYII